MAVEVLEHQGVPGLGLQVGSRLVRAAVEAQVVAAHGLEHEQDHVPRAAAPTQRNPVGQGRRLSPLELPQVFVRKGEVKPARVVGVQQLARVGRDQGPVRVLGDAPVVAVAPGPLLGLVRDQQAGEQRAQGQALDAAGEGRARQGKATVAVAHRDHPAGGS